MGEPHSSEAAPASATKPRWRRRFKIAAIVIVLLAVVLRAVMAFALPAVLSRVARFYGLDIRCQRESLALMGGHMGLWGVKVYPRGGGEPLLVADYVHGDILPWKLLGGKLHVLFAEADGVDLTLQRTPDGRIPLLEKFASQPTTQPTTTASGSSIDFTSPLTLEALRLNKVRAHLRDDAVSPKLDTECEMDLRVNHLGAPQGIPIEFQTDTWADRVLDSMRIEGTATGSGPNLESTATLAVRGLHAHPLAGYLTALGLKPAAESIGIEANIKLNVHAVSSGAVGGNLELAQVRMTADQRDFGSLATAKINAAQVGPAGADISSLTVGDAGFAVWREANGAMHVAGMTVVPLATSATASPASWRFPVKVHELKLNRVALRFNDASQSPPIELSVGGDMSITPRPLSSKSDIKANIELPHVARAVRLSGTMDSAATGTSAQLALSIEGIHPEALAPYLSAAGLESRIEDGQLTALIDLDKTQSGASVRIDDIRLVDSGDLLRMKAIDIAGARLDPSNGRLHVDSIDLVGPAINATRLADRTIEAAGVRIHPDTSHGGPSNGFTVPRVELGQFSWKGLKLALTDQSTPQPTMLSIDDTDIEIKNLLLDLSANAGAGKTGTIHAWLYSPQLTPDGLSIDGTITPGPQSIAAELNLWAEHLNATPLAPYLSPLGVQPTLRDGTLSLSAKLGAIGGFDQAMTSWVELSDLSLADGSKELAALDALKIDSLTFKGNECDVGKIDIQNARASAKRTTSGAIDLAGVRLDVPRLRAATAAAAPSTQPFVASLKQLNLDNAQLAWTDEAVSPRVSTTAYVTASVNDLTLGRHAPPATFSVQASADGIVDDLKIDGEQLDPTPGAELIKMNVAALGLRGAALDGYLPAGIESDLSDGRLHATVIASRLKGVRSAYLDLMNVDYRDGDDRLLSMDLGRLAASKLDWAADGVSIEEISLGNFESGMSIDAKGAEHFGGLVLTGARPQIAEPKPEISDVKSSESPRADVPQPLPTIVLNKLDLDVRRFTLRDQRRPNAAPLVLADVRVRNTAPVTLGGAYPESQPPAHFEITGSLEPVVGNFTLDIDTAPFAPEPWANLELSASGINGAGVTKLLPQFANELDGKQMTDGRFHALADVHARFAKRGPRDFDFSRPFDLDATAKDVTFRDRDVGRVLAGVEQVTADTIHIDPRTGNVHVKSIEVNTPIGYVLRDKQGIHALGLTMKIPVRTREGEAPAEPELASEKRLGGANSSFAGSLALPTGTDLRIDRFTVSGADLRLEDKAVDPPLIVPIRSLDVEVRDVSTAALREDRPMRYSAILESDKIAMPAHSASTQTTESRELFSQIASSGSISLYPSLHGYTRTSLNGVELGAFKGEAGAAGVDLSNGILDADINTRFHDDNNMDVRSKFVLTDLKLTEPEHGPIQTHLKLSAPLDVVLPALRDPDGGITIPLNVPLENGKVSFGDAFGAATNALAQIMITAVASAPIKAVGGVGDVLNLGQQRSDQPAIVTLPFRPGDVTLSSAAQQRLNSIIERLKRDDKTQVTLRSEMSQEDDSIAYERANPPPADCRALAEKLRSDRADLAAQREALSARATAELGSSSPAAKQTIQQLADLSRQLNQIDDAMDHLYDMLRPGAAHQAGRRARATGIEISNARIKSVEDALLAAGIPQAPERIQKVAASDKPAEPGADGGVIVTIVQRKREK